MNFEKNLTIATFERLEFESNIPLFGRLFLRIHCVCFVLEFGWAQQMSYTWYDKNINIKYQSLKQQLHQQLHWSI